MRRKRANGFVLVVLTTLTLSMALAESAAPVPRGVHVAFAADPTTTATVVWFTDGATDPGSVVAYGATPALGSTVTGTSHAAPGVNALIHEVRLQGLAPASVVHYQVGGPDAWSPVRTFRTAPVGGSFELVAFADHGVRPQSVATVDRALGLDPDLVIVAGDLGYANGDQPVWDRWFDIVEPLAATRTFVAAPGNHEFEPGANGTATFRARVAQPGDERYFAFDYGRVHFLVLTSDVVAAAQENLIAHQTAFAVADLADAAARKRSGALDFIVVVQHHPLYGNAAALERQVDPALAALQEPMFAAFDVDVLLVGHNHHYERSKPMIAGVATTHAPPPYDAPAGYVQIVTGGGGHSLYNFVDPNDALPWSAVRARRYHIVHVAAEPGALTVTALGAEPDAPAHDVLDRFTLRAAP